ncbi:MAG TPA: DUF4188 domain-containing protein [Chloroflexia bacterium]|nr:DUF4188 domain-containing protein [Chloroflexia bacterium]
MSSQVKKLLEKWSRSEPHRLWWRNFLKDSGGTGFWHETYFMRGGIEAIYDDMKIPLGLSRFAPLQPARGRMFSARARLGVPDEIPTPELAEEELYSGFPQEVM